MEVPKAIYLYYILKIETEEFTEENNGFIMQQMKANLLI